MIEKETLKSFKKHIDNGGVSFELIKETEVPSSAEDEKYEYVVLVMSAQYHGYPAIQSSIVLDQMHLGSDCLKEIGLMFLAAHEKFNTK